MKRVKFLIPFLFILGGCAYYNTFFNAEENYRAGLEKKENNTRNRLPADVKKHFNASISKSWRVIDVYGDSSSWADDALILIGKSYYHLEEYNKSQEILEQFLQKYVTSDLIPEAELWLAKTYLKQGDNEQALLKFSGIISKTESDEIRAEAFFNIGELFFLLEEYEKAIENFSNCINTTSNSETAGKAQYKLADSYFQIKDYESAVEYYKNVQRYDLPILKQYDAVIQMVNSLLQLKDFERAEEILQNILRDQRFKNQYSMIATKLANMIEFQGDSNFAIEKYREVVVKYPRSEGSALASFYMAQIYEFEYGWLDSAKVKYDQVKKEKANAESAKEASKRSKILAEYLKIKKQLRKDRDDMFRLAQGDSALVDSLVTGIDTLFVLNKDTSINVSVFNENSDETNERGYTGSLPSEKKDKLKKELTLKEKKVAVSRDPKIVESSLLKNDFRIAEFFLLNYQHYDSAKVSYIHFIENHTDSLLTPKAYFSLYYIYKDIDSDLVAADSLKALIIEKYPNTIYGRKLLGKEIFVEENAKPKKAKIKFLNAENLVDEQEYNEAIQLFNEVAIEDSGSVWATKSRYASAYIYENYLSDTENAYKSYSLLAKEYPKSPQGKIAVKKIAEPPKEVVQVEADSSQVITPALPDSSEVKQNEFLPRIIEKQ